MVVTTTDDGDHDDNKHNNHGSSYSGYGSGIDGRLWGSSQREGYLVCSIESLLKGTYLQVLTQEARFRI